MGRLWWMLCLGLLLPALAAAQRPGIGGISRGKLGAPVMSPGIDIPKIVNPVNLLVEHRQELSLSDTQFVRVLHIKRTLDSTNSPLMRKLDSVSRLFKKSPLFSEPSRQRHDSLAQADFLVRGTVIDVEQNIADAKDKPYALLSASQLPPPQHIEATARKASAATGRGRS